MSSTSFASTEVGSPTRRGFTWQRIALLVFLFLFINIPGWIAGVYLILKWTGKIRGMSPRNEAASAWAFAAMVVSIVALGLGIVVFAGPTADEFEIAAAGAEFRLWLVVPVLVTVGTFYAVHRYGPPRILKADWSGFWIGVAVAAVGLVVSMNSFAEATAGGGRFVVLWGAVLWGVWKALKSLGSRPTPT